MYEYFYGTIKEIYSSYVVLEVNDIAYQIFLIRNSELSINSKIKIYIYNFVSDSLNVLFGFYTPLEKNIFANLLKVKNIGVKSAYVILNKVNVDLLLTAIYQDNDEFLLKLPKVNKNNIDNLKKSLRKEAERNVKVDVLNSELFILLKNFDYQLGDILKVIPMIDKNNPVNVQLKEAINYLDNKEG